MRLALLTSLTFGWLLLGATCLPLITEPQVQPPAGTTLAISIEAPRVDATVPQDTVIDIHWTALNDTGVPGSATVWVESRVDLTRTNLVEDLTVSGSVSRFVSWDTSGFASGAYALYAEITTAVDSVQATSPGKITVDGQPTFEFTEPTENATFTDGDTLTIRWTGSDPEGSANISIGLDPDTDHVDGNEIFIHEDTLTGQATANGFNWTGADLNSTTVDPGVYHLFALVNDQVNPERAVDAGVQITVQEAGGTSENPVTLGITAPADDTTFLTSDSPLTIEYTVNQFEDVLIDLKIDTDDNHSNGNEGAILSQHTVTGGTQSATFNWDGTFAGGGAVPDGIYRLFIVMSTGTGTPQTAEGPGLIFRRSSASEPLVALLQPSTIVNAQAGNFVTIRWRDDDPATTATIRLTIDDDAVPDQHEPGTPDDMAELQILSGRSADLDGTLQDSFAWQVPGTLPPGTYYVFAYVVVGGIDQQNSVAGGRIIIPDPTH